MIYSFSNSGESCKDPIKTMQACKKSTESLEGVTYAEAKGDGKQLPHGCVLDEVTPGKAYVYWNENGRVKSFDPYLKTICHTS